ncbi:protein quiver-like [Mya arenaria]|uniref:protein quiver-like n=1 Tax=Mya arenaria TaxID=6604 RepID=UPI0022E02FAD|nr:protein quiver-like [Mya arenaria]
MDLLKYTGLLSLISILTVDYTDGIQCYSCSHKNFAGCNDPFNKNSMQGYVVDCPFGMCGKKKMDSSASSNQYQEAERWCHQVQGVIGSSDDMCSEVREPAGKGEVCYCNTDLCNHATSRPVWGFAILLPVALLTSW